MLIDDWRKGRFDPLFELVKKNKTAIIRDAKIRHLEL